MGEEEAGEGDVGGGDARAAGVRSGPGVGLGGCGLALFGAAAAPLAWAPRAADSVHGGFEGHARDLSVLYVDLPLVVLGGALLPLGVWACGLRWVGRPWVAAVAAVAALGLGVWGLTEWWAPRRAPDPGYGPGI
ncbi:hypothetical protein O7599_19950 [Streptomyces sp. WMMC500]|uniref:hypothetical protein n=1 Tax=Streptomyces sp. WMMC500 TaxID=3015154 RepID=UPI00248B055A|nr:hypothetical protein [Streptomyces sp. WMMC500]WBB57944.1 hypothetical protein O7599_19950 [Streptomyces sp. WMMC500]